MTGNYTITEVQLPLVGGIGGHNFLVLKDSNGNVIDELDGLATSSNGDIKPIGYLPSDTLTVYEHPGGYFSNNPGFSSYPQAVISSGSEETVMAQWNAALAAMNSINSESLSYPFMGLGSNSNSVASTLDAVILHAAV